MSRVFTDENLLQWEVYPTSGRFGLPEAPRLIFHCLSMQDRKARWVSVDGDEADVATVLDELSDDRLREMLAEAQEVR